MVRPVFQLHGGGRRNTKRWNEGGEWKGNEKIFPLNRLCHSREWKTMRKFSKIIAETFGGEGESCYLCTRNRERCGKPRNMKKLHEKFGGLDGKSLPLQSQLSEEGEKERGL